MKVLLGEILSHNQGDTMTTIQQLLNEFSNKIPPPPPPSIPLFPSPLFPHKPSLAHSSSLTSFTNNIAAAASSPRFNPYSYNRYTSSFLGSHYSSALFSPFPQSPLQFHFPLTGVSQELERSHSPSVPDSPSPIVLERNEFCRK